MTESLSESAYWARPSSVSPPFELPDGYVTYYGSRYETRAMSAESVMIHLRRETNYKGGDVDFWGKLVRRVLVEQKAFSMAEPETIKVKGNVDGIILRGSKQIGRKDYGYLVALAASKKYVYVFEAWGQKGDFDEDVSLIENAVKTLRVR
ncbi:MAG: hypothetical protein ACYS8Z_21385 [Planctomycetota bacterium]|jgi:hypothetical protein